MGLSICFPNLNANVYRKLQQAFSVNTFFLSRNKFVDEESISIKLDNAFHQSSRRT